MRYFVLWLDAEGYAHSAGQIEQPDFDSALRHCARKINRGETSEEICGFFLTHAYSDFIRRHYIAPGSENKRRIEEIESSEVTTLFPHLRKPNPKLPKI